jgi:hypothetical protein
VEGKRRDLEPEACEQQGHAEHHERMAVCHRCRDGRKHSAAGGAVHERHAVDDYGRRGRAHEKEFERSLRRDRVTLQESSKQEQRDRHQLEPDKQQDQLACGCQNRHAEHGDDYGEMVLSRAPAKGLLLQRE